MIYVVTDGDYSDYHIIAATVHKEAAERLAKRYNAHIEEYEDGIAIPDYPIWRCEVSDSECQVSKFESDYAIPDAMDKRFFKCSKRGGALCYVFAKDEDHARKIACDRYAEWKAMQTIGDLYK